MTSFGIVFRVPMKNSFSFPDAIVDVQYSIIAHDTMHIRVVL